ncbi:MULTISPECIES: ABC transporter permease [Neptunomonas]|uniref:Tungstate transport system permease protein n=2 Tax=Neptunomonas qingdaonensis TaxID=1045558 RepID=A0A1I2RF08_9GAMM|nr:ABC transporter permease [Neptunomonas qingdaonensis]SFG39040.1 tungstate transport system permease protein [Neptunomonas qingdaonensis]
MDMSLLSTCKEALALLFNLDAELWSIIGVSFRVSIMAILLSAIPAILVGFLLAIIDFPGRWVLIAVFNALMSVPTVVIGLTLYLLLSRNGPFGELHLLFSQPAMVIGQILLCFPILVCMSHAAFQGIDRRAWETARTLGAHCGRAAITLACEARFALLAAMLAGFSRIISEVGCSMMVGGNILGYSRNIPTAIALETSKGEFAQGIALGLVLLLLALVLNFALASVRGKGQLV